MSEMIERVKRAIEEARDSWTAVEYDDESDHDDDYLRALARAAIASMREPTDAMCDAATRSTSAWLNSKLRGVELRRLKLRIRWGAMIDAALSTNAKRAPIRDDPKRRS